MRRYLIVDDNFALAENLAEILRDHGAEVVIAQGGEAALVALRESLSSMRPFNALLSDMRMPLMGGAELVREARGIDPGLPAVVMTAYVGDNDLEEARDAGLLSVLSKPVPIDLLVQLLLSARRDGIAVVIEADESMLQKLCEALRSHGYGTVTAASLLDAQGLALVRPFCALVDLCDPVDPGVPEDEAMRRLVTRFPELPIVVLAARGLTPPKKVHCVFVKPVDTGKLLSEVDVLHRRVQFPASAPSQDGPEGAQG